MNYTREHALEMARQILFARKIKYTGIGVPLFETGQMPLKDKPVTDIWVIDYTYMVFQDETAFIYLDDHNELALLYILTKHGRII